MNRHMLSILGVVTVVLLVGAGCQTMRTPAAPMANQVVPGPDESIIVDTAMLVVDASGSMYPPEKFRLAKELARSFASAMPDGDYSAGILSYGGNVRSRWLLQAPRPFARQHMQDATASLRWLRGDTPLSTALDMLHATFDGAHGNSALVVFSDGKTDAASVLDVCTALQSQHEGLLCIHTVQFGDDPCGRTLLENMAKLGPCGSFRTACDIESAEGMAQFVRDVFLGSADFDSDGDGVPDRDDRCPNTPRGAQVDMFGCWSLGDVLFDYDKASLRPDAQAALDSAATVLRENPRLVISIEGHTDSRGRETYNQSLSEHRAMSVFDGLVARGIESRRLAYQGYGESRPRVPNDSPANMQLNRRVELRVVE